MENVREIADLYKHLAAVADKYSSVAAVNRLETLGLTGPEADKVRLQAGVWEKAARDIRMLGSSIQADVEHTEGLQASIADGSNVFLNLMKQARDRSLGVRRVA